MKKEKTKIIKYIFNPEKDLFPKIIEYEVKQITLECCKVSEIDYRQLSNAFPFCLVLLEGINKNFLVNIEIINKIR